ncbi:hypothetical protein FHR23_002861 [Stakelama sediminis]|uniref:Uncharacterized protein n=1 Tax=Stakelama sediminis TaxID=463200 RepID=A0A840Z1W0_9SPHN|nr:hypothetical protein [Stakelama sediminis]
MPIRSAGVPTGMDRQYQRAVIHRKARVRTDIARLGRRFAMSGVVMPANRLADLPQKSVADGIDPSVKSQFDPSVPSSQDHAVIRERVDLRRYIGFAKPMGWTIILCDYVSVLVKELTNWRQPLAHGIGGFFGHGCLNSAASIVTHHHDVPHPEGFDSKLQGSRKIRILGNGQIGDIAMHEHFTGNEINDLGCRHAAVGTSYPEKVGLLLSDQTIEKFGVDLDLGLCPRPIAGKQTGRPALDKLFRWWASANGHDPNVQKPADRPI